MHSTLDQPRRIRMVFVLPIVTARFSDDAGRVDVTVRERWQRVGHLDTRPVRRGERPILVQAMGRNPEQADRRQLNGDLHDDFSEIERNAAPPHKDGPRHTALTKGRTPIRL